MEEPKEERRSSGRMSVPAFGEWDHFKDGVVPTYSVDFSKIREIRRQNKSRVSIGNEEELLPKNTKASSSDDDLAASIDSRRIVHQRSPTRMKKIMDCFACGCTEA